jgi:hypothetical protein
MGKVRVKRSLILKNPILSAEPEEELSTVITIRQPKTRKTGRKDHSDYSELMQDIERRGPINERTTLTKAIVNDLQTYVERGLSLEDACILTGITHDVFKSWRQNYPEFDDFISRCMIRVEDDALNYIKEAMGGGTWQASAWMLERKYPAKYGKRDMLKQEIFYSHQKFVKIILEVINEASPELRATVVNRLRASKIDLGDQR